MSEKLERCPFCGGEVSFWTRQAQVEDYQALIIDCEDCPANMEEWIYKYDKNFAENFEKKKAEMFEAWNRRFKRIAKVKNYQDPIGMGGYGDCSECGAEVNEQYTYCPNCGARLEWNEPCKHK